MTDTDTTNTNEPAPGTDVESADAAAPDTPAAPAERTPFWQRPLVEQFLVPLVLPLAAIFVVVVYVLNLSRLFLSAHGHLPIINGTTITIVILVGAAILSYAAPRMRTTSIALVTVGFLLAIFFAGWISIGHSEEKNTGPESLAATLKTTQTIAITEAPGGQLAFSPTSVNAKTGLATMNINFAAAGHTFAFHEATTLFKELAPTGAGPDSGVALFPSAGDYNFYCTVPGHEAAGMHGVVHVTGPTVTLQQALTAAGNPASAAGGK